MIRWRRVALFLGLTYGICSALAAGFALSGLRQYGTLAITALGMVYMIVPALVAIVLIKGRWKERLGAYGVRFRRSRVWVFAWVLPVAIMVATVLPAAVLNIGEVAVTKEAMVAGLASVGPDVAEQAAEQLDAMGRVWPLVLLVQALVAGSTVNAVFAFGEEMGWRGFLQRELAPLGFWRASALIGAIWGFWHTPMILLGHNFPEYPVAGVVVMTVSCIPLGILISWVTVRTGSVFSAAVFHGVFNAASGYTILAISGVPNIIRASVGVLGFVVSSVLVVVLYVAIRWGLTRVEDAP